MLFTKPRVSEHVFNWLKQIVQNSRPPFPVWKNVWNFTYQRKCCSIHKSTRLLLCVNKSWHLQKY